MNFRLIGKIGLLVVIIGFFMPIACDQNGFQIAGYLMEADSTLPAILLYVLFIAAVVGCVIGVLLLIKQNAPVLCDWICILVCIASGLIVFFTVVEDPSALQSGAYVIMAGWIIALAGQIISAVKRES